VPEKPWEPCWSRIAEATPGYSFPDQCLHALRKLRGERTAALDLREIVCAEGALAKGFRQDIGRRDRVLNGKIDPTPPTGDMA
jgi:hypothetical protein